MFSTPTITNYQPPIPSKFTSSQFPPPFPTMDSASQTAVYRRRHRNGSGGKILKQLPTSARKTPYDRPTPTLRPENRIWINALAFPARLVTGGAGGLFLSLWNPGIWVSNSSFSERDSDSEGGIADYERDEDLHDDDAELNQKKGSSSGKSEILYLVEQLLTLERFSREECDRLIKIINLRVEDYTRREGVDSGPNHPNIRNKVIMEARKKFTENAIASSLKPDLDNKIHGSKSLVTSNRDYFSGGSWNIPNEMQRLHSKAVELMKPTKLFPLEAPKRGNETMNMHSKDTRTTQHDVPAEALIKEKYQIVDEKDFKDDKKGDDVNRVEGNSDMNMITEYAEVADVINASQGSSNTNVPTSTFKTDNPNLKQAVTRTRKYNTRRGRPRGK